MTRSLLRALALACAALATLPCLALAAPVGPKIIIAQFQTAGAGGGSDEFLELVNVGDQAGSIQGSDLLRQPSEANPAGQCKIAYVPQAVVLQPGQHYLETGAAYSGSVPSDHTLSGAGLGAAACGGTDFLNSSLGGLVLNTVGGDVVGYGGTSSDFPTYGTFAAPASGGSAERLLFGSRDTDSPSDWTLHAVSHPRNSSFVDPDFDGITSASDNCPSVANADQADRDHDGIGDACDPDNDNDGVANNADNCPLVPNADQLDSDHDGLGNACDADDDNDGVPDAQDAFPLDPTRSKADSGGSGGGGGGADTTAPSLTHARRQGARLAYTLSEAAHVTFTVELALPGRKLAGACRKPTRANRRRPRCSRLKLVGRFTQAGVAGANAATLPSRIGGKRLGAGSYRITLAASDAAGNRAKAARVSWTVARRR